MIKVDPADNVTYLGDKEDTFEICINDNILMTGKGRIGNKQELENGSVYYSIISSPNSYIFKNNGDIVLEVPFNGNFLVNKDESQIAYLSSEWRNNKIVHALYINKNLVYKANGFLTKLKFTPDGKRLYYCELRQSNQFSPVVSYIMGPNVFSVYSGPHNRIHEIVFSNNSNSFACALETTVLGRSGVYILVNNQILGPYLSIKNDYSFTDDSLYFIFHRYSNDRWIEEKIKL
jgi:hypothetical protein